MELWQVTGSLGGIALMGFLILSLPVYATPGLAVDHFGNQHAVTPSSLTWTVPELAVDPCFDCFENAELDTSSKTYTIPDLVVDPCFDCFENELTDTEYDTDTIKIPQTTISPESTGSSGHSMANYFDKRALDENSGVTRLADGSIFIGSDDHDVILGAGTTIVNDPNLNIPIRISLCESPYYLPLPEQFCMIFYLQNYD